MTILGQDFSALRIGKADVDQGAFNGSAAPGIRPSLLAERVLPQSDYGEAGSATGRKP